MLHGWAVIGNEEKWKNGENNEIPNKEIQNKLTSMMMHQVSRMEKEAPLPIPLLTRGPMGGREARRS